VGCASAAVVNEAQAELFLISKLLVVVLKMINPVEGLDMASRFAVLILGGKNPCVIDATSTNPSLRTEKIVLLAFPTFNAVVAEVIPAPTTSNLLEGSVFQHPPGQTAVSS
jgi:hypothetical protein